MKHKEIEEYLKELNYNDTGISINDDSTIVEPINKNLPRLKIFWEEGVLILETVKKSSLKIPLNNVDLVKERIKTFNNKD